MYLDDFTWGLIYRSRFVLTMMGWLWAFCGAGFLAMWLAYDGIPSSVWYHVIFDTLFGAAHLWLAKKAKEWKNESRS